MASKYPSPPTPFASRRHRDPGQFKPLQRQVNPRLPQPCGAIASIFFNAVWSSFAQRWQREQVHLNSSLQLRIGVDSPWSPGWCTCTSRTIAASRIPSGDSAKFCPDGPTGVRSMRKTCFAAVGSGIRGPPARSPESAGSGESGSIGRADQRPAEGKPSAAGAKKKQRRDVSLIDVLLPHLFTLQVEPGEVLLARHCRGIQRQQTRCMAHKGRTRKARGVPLRQPVYVAPCTY